MKIMARSGLAGENCKYNGGNNWNEKDLLLMAAHEMGMVCPKQMDGLLTPRVPAAVKEVWSLHEMGGS